MTGERGGRTTLEALDRANLFLVPLDDSRHWYRYHHLFADMLQARLLDERPDEVGELHRRASNWYDRDGQPGPAVRHAVAAGDVDRAADLVERASPALRRARQEATVRGWLDVIPDDVVRTRPVLAAGLIGALMSSNEFDGVEERLQDLERLDAAGNARRLGRCTPGGNGRAGRAGVRAALPVRSRCGTPDWRWWEATFPRTLRHAERAIDRAAADDHVTRAGASGISGLAFWSRGDLAAAERATPRASMVCCGPDTYPTCSDVRSRWRTSVSPGVGWVTRCAPMSATAARLPAALTCSGERRTCTWG